MYINLPARYFYGARCTPGTPFYQIRIPRGRARAGTIWKVTGVIPSFVHPSRITECYFIFRGAYPGRAKLHTGLISMRSRGPALSSKQVHMIARLSAEAKSKFYRVGN